MSVHNRWLARGTLHTAPRLFFSTSDAELMQGCRRRSPLLRTLNESVRTLNESDSRSLALSGSLWQSEGMALSAVPSQEPVPKSNPDRPLLLRLYSCPHLVALVRLFGDRELDTADAERALKPLYEQFGKERVSAACEELLDDRRDGKVVVFRLKGDVRQLAVQILGPIPASLPVPESTPVSTEVPTAVPVKPIAATERRKPLTDEPPHPTTAPTLDPSAGPVESRDEEPCGIANFETFLVHFWLTGSEELCEFCMGLIEQAREDVPLCAEVTEQGWSVEAAAVHSIARDLRAFVEQEALENRTDHGHADLTRQMLDRVDWRELAESFLSGD